MVSSGSCLVSPSLARIAYTLLMRMQEGDDTQVCINIADIGHIEKVQKVLMGYVGTTRLFLTRFFFLFDADVLSSSAEATDPPLAQPHIGKAFEGVAKMRYGPGDTNVEAGISAEIIP